MLLKKDDRKTELKEEVMMGIDQEVMIGAQLVPLDEDGWSMFSEDKGSGLHDGHDERFPIKTLLLVICALSRGEPRSYERVIAQIQGTGTELDGATDKAT